MMPSAEVEVTGELVRDLLKTQHPDLASRQITQLANGWDNVLYRIGGDLIARLPRREQGARLVRHEQRWLPGIASRLPLPVPVPLRTGEPARNFPWSWSIVPFLPGEPAAVSPPRDPRAAAETLGGFLRQLHQPAPRDAPVSAFRGVPLSAREASDVKNLGMLDGQVNREAVLRIWDEAKAAPPHSRPPVWVHGDLHPLNILVHDGGLSGVIDFGDLTAGDPATDLSVAWMIFDDPDDRRAFWDSYEADQAARTRAKGWAMAFAAVFLAHSADNPVMDVIGRRAYANLVTPTHR